MSTQTEPIVTPPKDASIHPPVPVSNTFISPTLLQQLAESTDKSSLGGAPHPDIVSTCSEEQNPFEYVNYGDLQSEVSTTSGHVAPATDNSAFLVHFDSFDQNSNSTSIKQIQSSHPSMALAPKSADGSSATLPISAPVKTIKVPTLKAFRCDFEDCGKNFSQLAHLKIHQRKHTGERPYCCNFPNCSKSFTQLGNLRTHERKHTGEKPFRCSYPGCDKVFSQMGNMKTHEMLHLGLKPYTCKIDNCGRSFSQLGNLKSHQTKVHINGRKKEKQPAPTKRVNKSAAGGERTKKRKKIPAKINSGDADSTNKDASLESSTKDKSQDLTAVGEESDSINPRSAKSSKEQKILKKLKAVLTQKDGDELSTSDESVDESEDEQMRFDNFQDKQVATTT